MNTCPVERDQARELAAIARQARRDSAIDRLSEEYTTDGIDWTDAICRTDATLAKAADVIALVSAMPDCPARRAVQSLLHMAASDYAACQLARLNNDRRIA